MAIREWKYKGAWMAVIAFFTLVGVIFLLATAYLALAVALGSVYAALIVALGCFAIAVIGLFAIKASEARRRRRMRERREAEGSSMLVAMALAALPSLTKRPLLAAALPIIALAAYGLVSDGAEAKGRHRSRGNS
ncbi:hypothetical protein GCM10011491_25700 [Brucella endophytica]|uniref:Phage holin family protein n=1 Tax=Brucella endophytica TaxID=1963359 RepID=A0A916SHB0_9HYPH|nr:hypothetical protein [Brucella endophytica]GGA96168.1 hypothetical protein GCM10011491_25700 [Brucella endophytica]